MCIWKFMNELRLNKTDWMIKKVEKINETVTCWFSLFRVDRLSVHWKPFYDWKLWFCLLEVFWIFCWISDTNFHALLTWFPCSVSFFIALSGKWILELGNLEALIICDFERPTVILNGLTLEKFLHCATFLNKIFRKKITESDFDIFNLSGKFFWKFSVVTVNKKYHSATVSVVCI